MADQNTPEHSEGFGAAEDADASRQAQHSNANDTPTDVNFNAIVARSQALTVETAGRSYESAASRQNNLANIIMGKMGLVAAGAAE